jgi:hypothetical protein
MSMAARQRADLVAGFLCAFAIALAGIAAVRQPGLLGPAAMLVALVGARMTEAHRTLAGFAVGASIVGFFIGMVVAIATDNAIY